MTTDSMISRLRRFLLALIIVCLAGMGTELLLLEHYESAWQMVPLGLIATALVVTAWHAVASGPASVRVLRVTMAAFVVAGLVGIVLHYRGNLEFQLDIDPAQSSWALFTKVIRAKAPPALAPGAMAQLGLLGLIYAYRHPAMTGPESTRRDRT